MTKPRLTYFDAPVSRGEECRLALHLAGVDFEDVRIGREQWASLKPTTPFGSLPVFELPGRPPLAQSNAILVYVGRTHGLHPADDFEAALHEAVLHHAEDLRATMGATLRITDDAERKRVRQELAATYVPEWAKRAERQIGDEGPFFAGAKVHVVDIKLHRAVYWFASGTMDHVPADVFDGFPKLMRVYNAFSAHPGVKAWYARG